MPPPDDPSYASSSNHPHTTTRAWFPPQHVISYQSGGIPTFNTSQAGGIGAVEEAEAAGGTNAWETRYGARVDLMAAFAYLLGPLSGSFHSGGHATSWAVILIALLALLLLIVETHNDYVRFHGQFIRSHTTVILNLPSSIPICLAVYSATHLTYTSIPAWVRPLS